MAIQRYNKYQYETSPRKIQPEYEPYKEKINKKRPSTANTKKQDKHKKTKAEELKVKRRIIMYLFIGFAILLTISYRNSLINESFNKAEDLKKNLAAVQKENEQLKVNIQNSQNVSKIEEEAKIQLGMQKLNNSQKRYIVLDKKDYVEAATEKIELDEEKNIFQRIYEMITKIY